MYHIISIAAVIAYFTPLVIVTLKRAWTDPFFKLFAAYWTVGGLINLLDIIPGVSRQVIHNASLFYNMLDIPFILAILHYTTSYTFIRKTASAAIALFAVIQIAGIIGNGLSFDALKYALAFGVSMVLVVVTMEIIRYMQKIEHTTRQNAKMFVYAAVLFEYATFIVIYVFDYIIATEDRTDSFIIYYVSSVVAMLIACCGFLMFSVKPAAPRSIME